MGSDFEDLGVYSVMRCKNTVNASSSVIVNVIFSPESGGTQKHESAYYII
jgi:hypothetical protein